MNLHYSFSILFDFLFPPSEEALSVRNLTEKDMVHFYTPQHRDGIHSLSAYQNKNIRALIHEAKFHQNKHAWKLLNILLMLHFSYISSPVDYIIPIPLSKKRMRERGYNQVFEILNAHHAAPSFPILSHVLVRTRDTKPQTELERAGRLTNVRDAFGVADPELITGKHILLIDDVTTTGATLNDAKAALLEHSPASVTCIAIAH